jgi:hypothetical protein
MMRADHWLEALHWRGRSPIEREIETLIDGKPFVWRATGEFAWGAGPPSCRPDRDPLLPGLGIDGCRIVDLPPGCFELMGARAAAIVGCRTIEMLESYHLNVDDTRHIEIIEKTRELRFHDLGITPRLFTVLFGEALDVCLSEILPGLGRDHVQLRINRPGSTDYNPPHRDASLPVWETALNVWIPIAGVDNLTSLPLVPGSHLVAEEECWQTKPGGAAIGGRRYRVPVIARLRQGPLRMVRSRVTFGQALLFTPHRIHGLAVRGARTRMALELRLAVLGK